MRIWLPFKLRVLVVGVLVLRALLLGVYIRAPAFWKLGNSYIRGKPSAAPGVRQVRHRPRYHGLTLLIAPTKAESRASESVCSRNKPYIIERFHYDVRYIYIP